MSLDSMLLPASLKASLDLATARYAASVHEAAFYLAGRGIDQAAATGHLLGVVCDPVPGHERFRNWLAIPYVTAAGTVAMKFRCIADHDCRAQNCQRYDSPAGQKRRLYNATSLSEGGEVAVVVEGELSAVILQSALSVPCVAAPGAAGWADHWGRCFSDFDRVLIIADHDAKDDGSDPGMKHAQRVRKAVEGSELIVPPAGLDADEWLTRDGIETVKKAMGLG